MNILTGNVTIKRIWQLLKKTVTSADLANYSVAIDSQSDSDTKRIPLDELRVALLNSGLFDYRGDYDASVNLYPASGGSGTGGAILKANAWIVSVGGTIDGNAVIPGQILMAKVDNPGQTSANWFINTVSSTDTDAFHKSVSAEISALTAKTTPVDNDVVIIEDSETTPTAFGKKKLSWANIKTTLKAYFDGIYATIASTIGYTSTATASGTTILTVNSNYLQRYTGTLNHINQLPNTTTLTNGRAFKIDNVSTGIITVNSSEGNEVIKVTSKRKVVLICIDNTTDAVASWEVCENFESEKIACSNIDSNLANKIGAAPWSANFDFRLLGVYASVQTAPTGSTLVVDFNNGANSFLSTKLSIDAGEKTSLTAATAAVIDTNYQDYTAGTELTVDIDSVGVTIPGKALIFQYDFIRK